VGGGDVQAELAREYRKAAEEAAARGDWRRAAFIYGKLLHDYRLAAAVLERGGLHHDAAVIYLELLSDTLGAARAFEAAGEVDRALQLYRRRGDHVAAGDLLRRAGEEDLALEEYRQAAAVLAAGDNHLAAGELMIERGRRPDLALEFFAAGWALRPRGSAQACLLRLAEIRAAEESPKALLALAAEADDFFAPPGNDSGAAQFYNALARLAGGPHLKTVRDDLRDRALVGLANKLRQRAGEDSRPGNTVSLLLGQSGEWGPALVGDADFAFRAALRRPPPVTRLVSLNRIRLGTGPVTAVCAAPQSGCVFAGFADGGWARFDPQFGHFYGWPGDREEDEAVTALATNEGGNLLVVLYAPSRDNQEVASFLWAHGSAFTRLRQQPLPLVHGPAWLTPIAEANGNRVVGLWHAGRLTTMWARDLVPTGEITVAVPATGFAGSAHLVVPDELGAAVLLNPDSSGRPDGWLLFVGERLWYFAGGGDLQAAPPSLGWRPGAHWGDLHSAPPLSWRLAGGQLDLAGIGLDESVQWAQASFLDDGNVAVARARAPQTGYLAATLLGPGRVAAVRRAGIDWLRVERAQLLPWTATGIDLTGAVACFHSPPTNELLVVCRDGWLVRVPVPH
jgi:tetratricopeptide (TPR) repeat protein